MKNPTIALALFGAWIVTALVYMSLTSQAPPAPAQEPAQAPVAELPEPGDAGALEGPVDPSTARERFALRLASMRDFRFSTNMRATGDDLAELTFESPYCPHPFRLLEATRSEIHALGFTRIACTWKPSGDVWEIRVSNWPAHQ